MPSRLFRQIKAVTYNVVCNKTTHTEVEVYLLVMLFQRRSLYFVHTYICIFFIPTACQFSQTSFSNMVEIKIQWVQPQVLKVLRLLLVLVGNLTLKNMHYTSCLCTATSLCEQQPSTFFGYSNFLRWNSNKKLNCLFHLLYITKINFII